MSKQKQKKSDIDDLLDELKSTKNLGDLLPSIVSQPTTIREIVDEEDLNKWIIQKASFMIQQGVDVSELVKIGLSSGATAEDIDAYSNLLKSVASAVDTLNKLNIQNKRSKSAKEVQQLKGAEGGTIGQVSGNVNNTFIVASREEIMDKLFQQAEEPKVIDVEEEKD